MESIHHYPWCDPQLCEADDLEIRHAGQHLELRFFDDISHERMPYVLQIEQVDALGSTGETFIAADGWLLAAGQAMTLSANLDRLAKLAVGFSSWPERQLVNRLRAAVSELAAALVLGRVEARDAFDAAVDVAVDDFMARGRHS